MALLTGWIWFQWATDVFIGVALMFTPLSLLARIPLPLLPKERLSIRLLGLYPAGLALAFSVALRDLPANQPALWIANAFRLLGGTALLLGATLDPNAPKRLKGFAWGEYLYVVITAVLMARAGLAWALPARAALPWTPYVP
jgi:hypothetical protein